jgi:hypothetical protein
MEDVIQVENHNNLAADYVKSANDMHFAEQEELEAGTVGREFSVNWEAGLRCLFILLMLSLLLWLTWRPGLGKLNLVLSFIGPRPGERLEWRAVDDPVILPEPIHGLPPTPEWRLGPNHSTSSNIGKSSTAVYAASSSRTNADLWKRTSQNAWSWHDDAAARNKNILALAVPPQKSMTAFRVGDIDAWPKLAEPVREQPLLSTPGNGVSGNIISVLPSLDANGENTILASLPALPPLSSTGSGNAGDAANLLSPQTATNPAESATPQSSEQNLANAGLPKLSDAIDGSAVTEEIDWKNREITHAIKGAYLIIYPKLNFVGLCVPDQGYIRKYNQVAVPRELVGEKQRADDGRIPYGRYYIADRHSDTDGPKLFLSWPSPDDAKRIGLEQAPSVEIEKAWERRDLPPQNTAAGGGVGLTGLRQWVDATDGGFALEAPHMEEIFTALPDKAWVIIADNE